MYENILIRNATVVNEGKSFIGDVLLADGRIEQIGTIDPEPDHQVIDATGNTYSRVLLMDRYILETQDSPIKEIYIPKVKPL